MAPGSFLLTQDRLAGHLGGSFDVLLRMSVIFNFTGPCTSCKGVAAGPAYRHGMFSWCLKAGMSSGIVLTMKEFFLFCRAPEMSRLPEESESNLVCPVARGNS